MKKLESALIRLVLPLLGAFVAVQLLPRGIRLEHVEIHTEPEHRHHEVEIPKAKSSSGHLLAQQLKEAPYRYYMYDDPVMAQKKARDNARNEKWTWTRSWGQRYKDYVKWELAYLKALEEHPWRVFDSPETADFIVIPIPINAISVAGDSKEDTPRALEALYQHELFQKFPEKHVWMTFLEYAFAPRINLPSRVILLEPGDARGKRKRKQKGNKKEKPDAAGLYMEDYARLENITTALPVDHHAWNHKVPYSVKEQQGWTCEEMQKFSWGEPFTKHSWSMSFMGAALDLKTSLEPLTVESFQNKTYHYLYHSRTTPSVCNSTPHRHALIISNQTREALHQPCSIGFDIDPAEWNRRFKDTKFCPCIRGDNPNTRCVFRSIRAGCIPIVISDLLEDFAPVYKSLLRLKDYSIPIREQDFLQDPAKALNEATKLTDEEVAILIDGVNLLKRMVVPSYPASLFVEAFAHETMASQQSDYYNYSLVGTVQYSTVRIDR